MSGLTYEQAKEALLAGKTIVSDADPYFHRKLNEVSFDAGASWSDSDSLRGMSTLDDSYACLEESPRDYRAERDALRLRLDSVLDRVDGLRADSVGMGVASARIRQLEDEVQQLRAAADACARHSFEKCTAAKHADALRGLATADVNLCGAVAVDSDVLLELLDAWQAQQTPAAPKWPAVGKTAPWATVWDHLKAEPRARYSARYAAVAENDVNVLFWGDSNVHPGEMTVMMRDGYGHGKHNRWASGRADSASDHHVYTRLPDAESP